jgi:hypothetical protein
MIYQKLMFLLIQFWKHNKIVVPKAEIWREDSSRWLWRKGDIGKFPQLHIKINFVRILNEWILIYTSNTPFPQYWMDPFWRILFLKLSYLDNRSRSPNYSMTFYLFLLSSLTCSQIWLISLVDDHQCGFITELLEKNKKQKKTLISSVNKCQ